ncbi:MAG TPA: hypothetical protein VFA54_14530 [Bryobacterales bacterium]|jgi:hypothetical protein|nr:hypothetical protein [Bryobacterales bacterium]
MPAPHSKVLHKAVALVALVAMLAIANATVLPGHWHNGPQGRSCDICRTGHLPSPQPLTRVEIQAPAAVEWRTPSVKLHAVPEPALISRSPRAPPV